MAEINDKWISSVDNRLTKIETILEERLGGYPAMAQIVSDLCGLVAGMKKDCESLAERVEKLEGNNAWLARLVLGSVIMALMAVVLVRGG